jgi:outer membrane murein-binding lipoprotein Lpp
MSELTSQPGNGAPAAPDVVITPVATATIETPSETITPMPIVEAVTAETPVEAPKIESPAIQPQIETADPVPAIVVAAAEPATDTVAKAPVETPAAELKLPPVTQLPEPVARLVGAMSDTAAPPPFLREHTTRTITATPPLRAEPRPGFKPKLPPVARPELKVPPKSAPKIEAKPDAKPERATPRQGRFALLAASIAICAGIGGAAGSVGIASLGRLTSNPVGAATDVQALRDQVAQLAADVAATRTNMEHLNRNTGTQFGKLVERFDKIDRAQSDPAAKLAKIGETLDKLEKRVASLPTTPAPTAAAAPAAANDVTGSITPRPAAEPKAPPKPKILEEFSLRRVYDGVALVEGRMGVIELVPGAPLPGGGRVEDIKREDGHWVVVTSRGLIITQR